MLDAALTGWLLEADVSLRWQVERDLLGLEEQTWAATRARVASEGFGARLLALQDTDGQWAGGAYFPAGFDGSEPGQPWTATTWTLNALREWGLDAVALADTAGKLATSSRWEYKQLPYWGGEADCCVNSWTLSNGLWLGADVDALVDWFLAQRLSDGGWNCEWAEGSTRSSFHSTLNSLKGLFDYRRMTGDAERVNAARRSGEEYLLARGLHRQLSTGETVADWALHFTYPFRWSYSVLNAADYFRAASLADGTAPDPRLREGIELIRSARQSDGTWHQGQPHPGRVWFEVDAPAGQPSKWLTFLAIRVLHWWDGASEG